MSEHPSYPSVPPPLQYIPPQAPPPRMPFHHPFVRHSCPVSARSLCNPDYNPRGTSSSYGPRVVMKRKYGCDDKRSKRGCQRESGQSDRILNTILENPWLKLMSEEEERKHFNRLMTRFADDACDEKALVKNVSDTKEVSSSEANQ